MWCFFSHVSILRDIASVVETLFLHLLVTAYEDEGHMTSLREVKVVLLVTEREK